MGSHGWPWLPITCTVHALEESIGCPLFSPIRKEDSDACPGNIPCGWQIIRSSFVASLLEGVTVLQFGAAKFRIFPSPQIPGNLTAPQPPSVTTVVLSIPMILLCSLSLGDVAGLIWASEEMFRRVCVAKIHSPAQTSSNRIGKNIAENGFDPLPSGL